MDDATRDAIANTYGPLVFFGLLAVPFVCLWLGDKAAARRIADKIGPHVVGPDEELYRIAKETRLNGDVWYRVEQWRRDDWQVRFSGEFSTAEEAQAAMDRVFELQRSRLIATREPASP